MSLKTALLKQGNTQVAGLEIGGDIPHHSHLDPPTPYLSVLASENIKFQVFECLPRSSGQMMVIYSSVGVI